MAMTMHSLTPLPMTMSSVPTPRMFFCWHAPTPLPHAARSGPRPPGGSTSLPSIVSGHGRAMPTAGHSRAASLPWNDTSSCCDRNQHAHHRTGTHFGMAVPCPPQDTAAPCRYRGIDTILL